MRFSDRGPLPDKIEMGMVAGQKKVIREFPAGITCNPVFFYETVRPDPEIAPPVRRQKPGQFLLGEGCKHFAEESGS
jgi:hypothetical protein